MRLAERESQLNQERSEHEAAFADAAAAATRAALSSNSPGSAKLRSRYEALKTSVGDMVTTINTERQWRVVAETRVRDLGTLNMEMAADLTAERETGRAAGDVIAALRAELEASRKSAAEVSAPSGPEEALSSVGEKRGDSADPRPGDQFEFADLGADDDRQASDDDDDSHESRLERMSGALTPVRDHGSLADDFSTLALGTLDLKESADEQGAGTSTQRERNIPEIATGITVVSQGHSGSHPGV